VLIIASKSRRLIPQRPAAQADKVGSRGPPSDVVWGGIAQVGRISVYSRGRERRADGARPDTLDGCSRSRASVRGTWPDAIAQDEDQGV